MSTVPCALGLDLNILDDHLQVYFPNRYKLQLGDRVHFCVQDTTSLRLQGVSDLYKTFEEVRVVQGFQLGIEFFPAHRGGLSTPFGNEKHLVLKEFDLNPACPDFFGPDCPTIFPVEYPNGKIIANEGFFLMKVCVEMAGRRWCHDPEMVVGGETVCQLKI